MICAITLKNKSLSVIHSPSHVVALVHGVLNQTSQTDSKNRNEGDRKRERGQGSRQAVRKGRQRGQWAGADGQGKAVLGAPLPTLACSKEGVPSVADTLTALLILLLQMLLPGEINRNRKELQYCKSISAMGRGGLG